MPPLELDKTVIRQNPNLVAYYRMESGALTTDSKGSNTLTNNGAITSGTGIFGGDADLGTSNSTKYFSGGDNMLQNAGANVSFSFWVKIRTEISSGSYCLFEQRHTQTPSTSMRKMLFYDFNGGSRRLRLLLDNAVVATQPTYTVTLGTSDWYHFVFTHEGTSSSAPIRLYMNGLLVSNTTWNNSSSTTGWFDSTNIGRTMDGASYASAEIDDLAVFKESLTPEQVKELYEGRSVGEFQLQPNLSAMYHFNGSSQDFSGNNNNGTDTAITYSFANGKFFQGAGFNGSSSLISYTPPNITTSITFGGWFRFNTVNSNTRGMFQNYQQNANPSGWSLFLASTNVITAVVGKNTGVVAGTDYQEVSTGTVSANIWYFVVATYNTSSLTIYLNGRSVQSLTAPSTITNPNVGRIGVRNVSGSNTSFLDGQADELFIFNRALSAQEIARWYAWSLGRFAQTL